MNASQQQTLKTRPKVPPQARKMNQRFVISNSLLGKSHGRLQMFEGKFSNMLVHDNKFWCIVSKLSPPSQVADPKNWLDNQGFGLAAASWMGWPMKHLVGWIGRLMLTFLSVLPYYHV